MGCLRQPFSGTVTLLLAGNATKQKMLTRGRLHLLKNGLTLLGCIQAKDGKDRHLTSEMRYGLLAVTFSGTDTL